MDLHEVAEQIAGDLAGGGLRLRQGIVDAVAADGSLTVRIGGSDVAVSGIRSLTGTPHTVGGAVWIAIDGPLVIAIGAIGSRTGIVEAWGGSVASIPAGSLLCNGASHLRTAYPALFAAIGTTWGSADGTHFNVPPADRFYVAAGGGYAAGAVGGEATHLLTAAESGVAAHTHNGVYAGYSNVVGTSAATLVLSNGATYQNYQDGSRIGPTTPASAAAAHENRPPYAALPFIIWT